MLEMTKGREIRETCKGENICSLTAFSHEPKIIAESINFWTKERLSVYYKKDLCCCPASIIYCKEEPNQITRENKIQRIIVVTRKCNITGLSKKNQKDYFI